MNGLLTSITVCRVCGVTECRARWQNLEYRHHWQYGDMGVWDNRSVMHQANGDYDMSEPRRLYCRIIKGSMPALSQRPQPPATARNLKAAVEQRLPA